MQSVRITIPDVVVGEGTDDQVSQSATTGIPAQLPSESEKDDGLAMNPVNSSGNLTNNWMMVIVMSTVALLIAIGAVSCCVYSFISKKI